MRMKWLTVSLALALAASAHASFTVIKGIDNWNAQVGPCTTLDFVFPNAQYLSTQYASLGAIFPEGNEVAIPYPGFQQDGWGCEHYDNDNQGGIDITFLWPQYAVGAWIVGDLYVDLYWQGQVIYESPGLYTWPLAYSFGGVVSTQPFDRVRMYSDDGFAFVDDVLFIPAPGAAALLALAGLAAWRRRRVA